MAVYQLLAEDLQESCPTIHTSRLRAVMDVAEGLQKSGCLAQASMGRKLSGSAVLKHKIKKVDRLEGNKLLHNELDRIYRGLSSYVFKYLSIEQHTPIVVDLCFIQDRFDVQMLSAEVAVKGRTIPVYREAFGKGDLKGRAHSFLKNVASTIPNNKKVLIIMDAGFGEDWLRAIESLEWCWLLRVRNGKSIKPSAQDDWLNAKEFMSQVGGKAKSYNDASIMKIHEHKCRVVTKGAHTEKKRAKLKKQPRNYNAGNGDYIRSAKEPWVLATNLPDSYNSTQVINFYKKRMQIEESFRDLKSPRFGLGARDARTTCTYRWGVKMLLAAIVQIVCWVVGVIGHSLGYQRKFQANTVRDKKVFSYFFLGQLIMEHDMMKELEVDISQLPEIMAKELARDW